MDNYDLPIYISKIRDRGIPKMAAKEIICGQSPPKLQDEFYIKYISDAQRYLQNNVALYVSEELFIKTYFLLTNRKMSKKNAQSLVDTYYKYLGTDTIEQLMFLMFQVDSVVKYRKREYALLLIYYFYLKIFDKEISLYPALFPHIKTMFTSPENMIKTLLHLKNSFVTTEQSRDRVVSQEELFYFFQENKNLLLCQFPIKRLYLFGSYASGTANTESDIDLLVIFDDYVTSVQEISYRNEMAKFISKKLNIDVDVISFHYATRQMELMSLNQIKIIY